MGRKSKKSDDTFSVIIIGLVFAVSVALTYPKFFIFCLLIAILGAIIYMWYKVKSKQFKTYDISYLEQMNPFEFEEYVCNLYKQLGYTDSYCTPKSGDFGADVIAQSKYEKITIQVKRHKPTNTVGSGVVQKVLGAQAFYNTTSSAIVTTSYFTPKAKTIAHKCHVKLIDRDELKRMLMAQK